MLIKGRAVDHVLEKEIFFLPGKLFSGQDAPVQGIKKFTVSGADRESFDQNPVDLIISGRVIIERPIPFEILDTGCPDLDRHSPLMEVFYGSPGLGFGASGDIGPVPRTDKGDFHFGPLTSNRYLVIIRKPRVSVWSGQLSA